jgi:hypothetical protein
MHTPHHVGIALALIVLHELALPARGSGKFLLVVALKKVAARVGYQAIFNNPTTPERCFDGIHALILFNKSIAARRN